MSAAPKDVGRRGLELLRGEVVPISFDLGGNIAYWERDPLKIIPNLVEVKPDYFPSVPRIFEKIYTAATGEVEKSGGIKKLVFNWAIGVGKKVRQKERAGEPIGWLLRKQYEIADKQVLSKVRALFGGNIKNCVTGAAPINPEILRFFDAADAYGEMLHKAPAFLWAARLVLLADLPSYPAAVRAHPGPRTFVSPSPPVTVRNAVSGSISSDDTSELAFFAIRCESIAS